MNERFAVAFREGPRQAVGALEVERDRLRLRGGTASAHLAIEISFADLCEVRVGRRPSERLNGYRTLLLVRTNGPTVEVAPLGMALLPEITDLLISLTKRAGGDELAVAVPLKPGCLGRARTLLAKGPPIDPASLRLTSHEVYLDDGKAVFVFRGSDLRAQLGQVIGHPAVWRAGLAWQRCFAGPPRIVETAELSFDAAPAYRWAAPG